MDTSQKGSFSLFAAGFVAIIVLIIAVLLSGQFSGSTGDGGIFSPSDGEYGMQKFDSEEEFSSYMAKAREGGDYYGGLRGVDLARELAVEADRAPIMGPNMGEASSGQAAPERVSSTNVQVFGIDEPDMVKTDGHNIYYSSPILYYLMRGMVDTPVVESIQNTEMGGVARMIAPDYQRYGSTAVIQAFPPADLNVASRIDEQGDLLLFGKTLVVLGNQRITAYNVSDRAKPKELWKKELSNNQQIITARGYNDTIYLIASTWVYEPRPCPIIYFEKSTAPLTVPCTEIYHPRSPTSINATYTVMAIKPDTGQVEDSMSFVGPSGQQVVYMSPDSIYVTYPYSTDIFALLYRFVDERASDLFPSATVARLRRVAGYELSQQTKLQELSIIIGEFYQSLEDDERLRVENELNNRAADYIKEKGREFERTSISKIAVKNLNITAEGAVPGTLLNQFSLDEYEGYLRAAVTVGGRGSGLFGFWGLGIGGNFESANDVYVLDRNLKTVGQVTGLGLSERIYSVRFVGDEGYVVTFRETDPFYVIDLSKPSSPKMVGELKIPGFSSYLHPMTEDLILGVGQEGSQVKLSLFDVSDPSKPIEKSKYNLNEYWSEVLNTHHAFLLDDKYTVFFMPGSRGGYIFSYANDTLTLRRAVSNVAAQRALFIDDYLYIIGQDRIVVLNEADWQEVNKLELR